MKMTLANQLNFSKNLHLGRYSNGQLAVYIRGFSHEPIAELSIMEDSIELAPDEFILKDYSENEILIQDCYESNLFSVTQKFVLISSHLCPVCKIKNHWS